MISHDEPLPIQARSMQSDDPSAIWLYRHTRDAAVHTPGQSRPDISLRDEWSLILHTARLYTRMGLDIMALSVGKPPVLTPFHITDVFMLIYPVRNWRFLPPSSYKPHPGPGQQATDTPGAVDRRDELDGAEGEPPKQTVEDDTAKAPTGLDEEGKAESKPNGQAGRKKVVEEPSAASILENFDF